MASSATSHRIHRRSLARRASDAATGPPRRARLFASSSSIHSPRFPRSHGNSRSRTPTIASCRVHCSNRRRTTRRRRNARIAARERGPPSISRGTTRDTVDQRNAATAFGGVNDARSDLGASRPGASRPEASVAGTPRRESHGGVGQCRSKSAPYGHLDARRSIAERSGRSASRSLRGIRRTRRELWCALWCFAGGVHAVGAVGNASPPAPPTTPPPPPAAAATLARADSSLAFAFGGTKMSR